MSWLTYWMVFLTGAAAVQMIDALIPGVTTPYDPMATSAMVCVLVAVRWRQRRGLPPTSGTGR